MPKLIIPFTGIKRQYSVLRQEILEVTDQVLTSGQVMSGAWTKKFEHWLGVRNDQEYVVTCHSGTQALEIIAEYYYRWADVDAPRILIPALTFPATANAFARAGWTVELMDVDRYGVMDIERINRSRHSYDTVCMVGLYGHALPDHIYHYTNWMIEDGAQHWLSNQCKRVGLATAISFDPTKNLGNYGNGGAVTTQDRQLYDFARDWTMHGKHTDHNDVGSNSRMSEVDCAQLMVKTKYIDDWQRRRRNIAEFWIEAFRDSPVRSLIDDTNFADHCFHKFVIDVDGRDRLAMRLQAEGIETKIHYSQPLWELPAFEGMYQHDKFMGTASSLSRRCLSLPIYPELTDSEVEYVASQVLAHVSSTHN